MIMGGGAGHGGGMMFFGRGGDQPGKRPSLSMYRRLLKFVAPYKWNLVFAAVLLVISTALGLVWPQVVQRVLDVGLHDPSFLDFLVVGLVIVLLVRAVIDGVRQYVMTYTGERVIFDLRMSIVRHMQSLSLSFFNVRKTGELMSHITSDATLNNVRYSGFCSLLFRWHWLNALPAATSIVLCGPSSRSDAKSTAYETDIVEPLVVSGR